MYKNLPVYQFRYKRLSCSYEDPNHKTETSQCEFVIVFFYFVLFLWYSGDTTGTLESLLLGLYQRGHEGWNKSTVKEFITPTSKATK